MSMTVSITCDDCGTSAEASTAYDSGTNEIDSALEVGWTHEAGEDLCPDCSGADAGVDDDPCPACDAPKAECTSRSNVCCDDCRHDHGDADG